MFQPCSWAENVVLGLENGWLWLGGGPHSRPRHHGIIAAGWCRVESRLVAERRGRAGTGHGYRHTGSHPFTLLHHHQQKHQHLQHQHQRWYQHQHPAYWVMATRMPPLQYLPKPGLRHQHQLHSHPSNLFVSFPTSKVFVSRALIFSWQLDVAACCSLSCLRSHPHLTPVNCCCGTSTMARYCKPPSGMVPWVLYCYDAKPNILQGRVVSLKSSVELVCGSTLRRVVRVHLLQSSVSLPGPGNPRRLALWTIWPAWVPSSSPHTIQFYSCRCPRPVTLCDSGGPLLYSSADRPITWRPDGTCRPPPWPPPYNAQPLQPSCKPLTTPCSSLPTTHVIPFWSPNTTLSARSTHLFISHPFFCPVHRWVSSGNSSWPPGGSAGPKFRRRSLSPFILFNTGD